MKRIDVYNAYNADYNFRHIAKALGFTGFEYEPEDDDFKANDDFKAKLENDDELGDLLEQLEDIKSSQFLIYTSPEIEFYNRYEFDILDYLENNGYDDNYNYYDNYSYYDNCNFDDNNSLKSIREIIRNRVVAYVTSVISEYVY